MFQRLALTNPIAAREPRHLGRAERSPAVIDRNLITEEDTDMKTLKTAKVGETLKVLKLHGEGPVKRRIMDMGITKGVEVYVRKVAPLGDPLELNVRGYELSLRRADAEMIEVE